MIEVLIVCMHAKYNRLQRYMGPYSLNAAAAAICIQGGSMMADSTPPWLAAQYASGMLSNCPLVRRHC